MHTGCAQSHAEICRHDQTPTVAPHSRHKLARSYCPSRRQRCVPWNSPPPLRLRQNTNRPADAGSPAQIDMESPVLQPAAQKANSCKEAERTASVSCKPPTRLASHNDNPPPVQTSTNERTNDRTKMRLPALQKT